MKKENLLIRKATVDDADKILEIYAPYIENTAITFEYDVPSIVEFCDRMKKTLEKYPYIVAEQSGEIIGYAYTGAFVGRAAYDRSVEASIYIKSDMRKCGVGRKLYEVLENISKAQNILNINACISYPDVEDEYLTKNSVQFHEHLGYKMVGRFHKCGYKFGKWYDMVWMEKMLGEHTDNPSDVIWFPDLNVKL